MEAQFSPAQQRAYQTVLRSLSVGNIVHLWGGDGLGKTTLLRELHRQQGGTFLNMRDFIDRLQSRHPLAIEETFERMVMDALREHDTVILDDLHLIIRVVSGCSGGYPRSGLLEAPAMTIAAYVVETGKRLVVGADYGLPDAFQQRGYGACIDDFEAEDYDFLCHRMLDAEVADRLEYPRIFRFASHLDGHQLAGACRWLRQEPELDTERFIEYLRSQGLNSNVDLEEVQQVALQDLKGCEEVIRSLEANIVVPLEQDELAMQLGLKAKRGVLLAGPPGTGKTTVGRALAHRLRGKFFLVDGTVISGTQSFYGRVHQIFQAAKENAPSVIFIDDSDVIFESGEELGLYRYLLTMLDGLESESNQRVCVMLTAMDVANIPPALLRSGRIELWLEMRLPDEAAREEILRQHLAGLPAELDQPDLQPLVAATNGFTGADLKRLVEDGKNLYAYDRVQKQPLRSLTDYFLQAVEGVTANRRKYAEAEAHARAQRAQQRPGFGIRAGYGASEPD